MSDSTSAPYTIGLPKQLCGVCSWRFRAEALTTNDTYPAILVWWSTMIENQGMLQTSYIKLVLLRKLDPTS
ncbi:MAG: hypothetical protein N2235_09865 [Fischerella sp.]|nr:hypothetical protein [Fischerella sp.]